MQPELKPWAQGPKAAQPPKFVPTLTEVVQALPRGSSPAPEPTAVAQGTPALPLRLDELALVARVMQDVDLHLEIHLRQAVHQLVSEHVSRLMPLLRTEIENKVHDAVRTALTKQMD